MIQITLPPDLEQFVETQINTGRFLSSNDLIQTALRLLQSTEPKNLENSVDLKQTLQGGIDDIVQGRSRLYPNSAAIASDIKGLARAAKQSDL